MRCDVHCISARQLAQGWRGFRRYTEEVGWTIDGRGLRVQNRRLLDNDVSVGAAEPERTHAGDTSTALVRPCLEPRGDPDRDPVPGDQRVRVLQMQVRRNLPVPQRQQHLDEPGYSGRGLEVTNIRF